MGYITYKICVLQYERPIHFKQRSTKRRLAASKEYYCQQCGLMLFLADKRDQLDSDEFKNKKTC